jgi:hypothetical protein
MGVAANNLLDYAAITLVKGRKGVGGKAKCRALELSDGDVDELFFRRWLPILLIDQVTVQWASLRWSSRILSISLMPTGWWWALWPEGTIFSD